MNSGPLANTPVTSAYSNHSECRFRNVFALNIHCGVRVLRSVRNAYPQCVIMYCGHDTVSQHILPDAYVRDSDVIEIVSALHFWHPNAQEDAESFDLSSLSTPGGRSSFGRVLDTVISLAPSPHVAESVLTRCVFEEVGSTRRVRWLKQSEFLHVVRSPVVLVVDGRSFWGKRFSILASVWPITSILVGFSLSSRQRTAAASSNPYASIRLGREKTQLR